MTLQSNNQITPETVGHWVRYDGHLLKVVGFADEPILDFAGWHRAVCAGACTYIGPDLGDGWIGWSGGENPIGTLPVQVRLRGHGELPGKDDGDTVKSSKP